MNAVMITVVGSQRAADGEEDRLELTTPGKCCERNGVHYITYGETGISGMEGTTTLLKVYSDQVTLVRMGSVEQKQEFRLGQENTGMYITPYGTFRLAAATSRLDIDCQAGQADIYIQYELSIDGQWQSSNELTIRVRTQL